MIFVGLTFKERRPRLYIGKGRIDGRPTKWQAMQPQTDLSGTTDLEIMSAAVRRARIAFQSREDSEDSRRHLKTWYSINSRASKQEAPEFKFEVDPWPRKAESDTAVSKEILRRDTLWKNLINTYPNGLDIEKRYLNDTGIFEGGSGCWINKPVTVAVDAQFGATVAVLYTGKDYPDDLSDDGLIYHYPETDRLGSRDQNEIEATKNCFRFGIPLFVITSLPQDLRQVRRGWIVGWNDTISRFFISFAPIPEAASKQDDEPESERLKRALKYVLARAGQTAFRFAVFARYGTSCAFCSVSEGAMIDAIHLKDHALNGKMDVENGLPACKNHHAAFDAGIVAVPTGDSKFECRAINATLDSLGITRDSLEHLPQRPSDQYLNWAYNNKGRRHKPSLPLLMGNRDSTQAEKE